MQIQSESLEFAVITNGSKDFSSILHTINSTQIWASFFLWIIFKSTSEILQTTCCGYNKLIGLLSKEKALFAFR